VDAGNRTGTGITVAFRSTAQAASGYGFRAYDLEDLRVTVGSLFGTTTGVGYEPAPGRRVGLALTEVLSLEVGTTDTGAFAFVDLLLVTGGVVAASLALRN
jgi:hypothetical protein